MTHTKKQQQLIEDLASICEELGWVIALPTMEESIPGLIIGQENFVTEVVSVYYGDNYEVFSKNLSDPGMKEKPQEVSTLPPTKKKAILH